MLGSPIAHSRSPRLHRAAYAALGLDWCYDAIEVHEGGLAAFLDTLGPAWRGLSLTMPLKTAVLPLLDELDPAADAVGAVNTVVLHDGRRHGHNTDIHGIRAALAEAGLTTARDAVVLGGGATARSALAALASLGARTVVLAVRSEPVQTLQVAARLGLSVTVRPLEATALRDAPLVLSTLPPGAGDRLAAGAAGVGGLLDVVYEPWPTALAAACPGTVVGGAQMLLHQAAAQVELMTGRPAPLAAMRAALGR